MLFQVTRMKSLQVQAGFQIPSSPPGWQARLLACDSRASCWDEPEPEAQGEVGVRWAKTPWWRLAGCQRCCPDPLPQAYREKETQKDEVIVISGNNLHYFPFHMRKKEKMKRRWEKEERWTKGFKWRDRRREREREKRNTGKKGRKSVPNVNRPSILCPAPH